MNFGIDHHQLPITTGGFIPMYERRKVDEEYERDEIFYHTRKEDSRNVKIIPPKQTHEECNVNQSQYNAFKIKLKEIFDNLSEDDVVLIHDKRKILLKHLFTMPFHKQKFKSDINDIIHNFGVDINNEYEKNTVREEIRAYIHRYLENGNCSVYKVPTFDDTIITTNSNIRSDSTKSRDMKYMDEVALSTDGSMNVSSYTKSVSIRASDGSNFYIVDKRGVITETPSLEPSFDMVGFGKEGVYVATQSDESDTWEYLGIPKNDKPIVCNDLGIVIYYSKESLIRDFNDKYSKDGTNWNDSGENRNIKLREMISNKLSGNDLIEYSLMSSILIFSNNIEPYYTCMKSGVKKVPTVNSSNPSFGYYCGVYDIDPYELEENDFIVRFDRLGNDISNYTKRKIDRKNKKLFESTLSFWNGFGIPIYNSKTAAEECFRECDGDVVKMADYVSRKNSSDNETKGFLAWVKDSFDGIISGVTAGIAGFVVGTIKDMIFNKNPEKEGNGMIGGLFNMANGLYITRVKDAIVNKFNGGLVGDFFSTIMGFGSAIIASIADMFKPIWSFLENSKDWISGLFPEDDGVKGFFIKFLSMVGAVVVTIVAAPILLVKEVVSGIFKAGKKFFNWIGDSIGNIFAF